MDIFRDAPFCVQAQRFYITFYHMLLRLDDNPQYFEDHLSKIAYAYDQETIDLYDVLRMYGLLYDPQTAYQISSYKCDDIDDHHNYCVNFHERWELFKRHNKQKIDLPTVANAELSDRTIPKARMFKQGKRRVVNKNICPPEQVWDETKLKRLRQKYGYNSIELVPPFVEGPEPLWKQARRYK